MSVTFELPEGDSCFFCEVIAGRQEKGIIEETDKTVTLVNNRQYEVGQVLVVARRHAPTLLDLTDEEATAVMQAARRVAQAIVEAYDVDGMTLYQNNGVVSLQEVPHFHLHVVPRRRVNSNWGEGPPHIAVLERIEPPLNKPNVRITLEQEREVAEIIRRYL
ncbi:HIT domain-containing protein [Candidatus Poribacteria bacterium]|nr:HIT domain-containing protein [Candidatus Poribacteria bacterium]